MLITMTIRSLELANSDNSHKQM